MKNTRPALVGCRTTGPEAEHRQPSSRREQSNGQGQGPAPRWAFGAFRAHLAMPRLPILVRDLWVRRAWRVFAGPVRQFGLAAGAFSFFRSRLAAPRFRVSRPYSACRRQHHTMLLRAWGFQMNTPVASDFISCACRRHGRLAPGPGESAAGSPARVHKPHRAGGQTTHACFGRSVPRGCTCRDRARAAPAKGHRGKTGATPGGQVESRDALDQAGPRIPRPLVVVLHARFAE